MPDFVFTAPYPMTYPESRDAYGVNLGTVQPGDVLRLGQAPDQHWAPYEGGGDEGESGEPPADPETPPETAPDVNPGE
jgi:hypothetical protein